MPQLMDVSKRDNYYKNLGENIGELRQEGWNEALPYHSIPGPKPLPVIGNTWRFLPRIGEYHNLSLIDIHKKLKEQYGDVVKLEGIVGRKPLVILFSAQDMENLLRNAGAYPRRMGLEAFVYYRSVLRKDKFKGVGGVLTVQGEDWFKFRSTVNPIMMQPRTVQQYTSKMDQIASKLVGNMKYLSSQNDDGELPDNFLNELYKWALESIGVVALDRRIGCLDLNADPNSESQMLIKNVTEMFELMYNLEIMPPIWKYISTPAYKRFVEILDWITEYIEEGLAKNIHESVPDHQRSVLHRLAEKNKQVAIAMVTDMLIAGIDTTGKTLGAALYFLAKNPEKQNILREEILQLLPERDSPVTNTILANSTYLKAVIKETTRIAPIAVGNLRTTVKDMVLHGYQIPRNSEVLAMHIISAVCPTEFQNPQEFSPERWLRTTEDEYSYKNAHLFASMPFGFGPRSCIGKRFANLELEVGITRIIRNLELTWNQPEMRFDAQFLHGISDPLKLTVKSIEN